MNPSSATRSGAVRLAAAAALAVLSTTSVTTSSAAADAGRSAHRQQRHAPVRLAHRHPGPNLALRLSASATTVNIGEQLTYTATVVNTGGRVDRRASFRDLVPGKATLVSTSPSRGSCSGSRVVVCKLGSLARGASATITIVVTASRPGWMTDYAWVSTKWGGGWDHRHAVPTNVRGTSSNVVLELTGSPGTVDTGQQVTYTATVSNTGNDTAGTVAFQNLLPGKATLVSASSSQGNCSGSPMILCELGSLTAGASATITIVVTADQPGKMTDHGWVSANPPGHWQHERSVDTRVRDVAPALALRLTASAGSVTAGEQVTFTATVTNTGTGSDTNAGFQDLLPGNTTLVSATASQGTCSGNPTVECDLGLLDRGDSATITIVVIADRPGTITDRAWVSTDPPGNWEHQHSVATQVQPPAPAATTASTTHA
jgi:uncharacterized repeat protein (TIGR01451 family)